MDIHNVLKSKRWHVVSIGCNLNQITTKPQTGCKHTGPQPQLTHWATAGPQRATAPEGSVGCAV